MNRFMNLMTGLRLGSSRTVRKPVRAQTRRRLSIEALEDRQLLSASPNLGPHPMSTAVVPGAAVAAATSTAHATAISVDPLVFAPPRPSSIVAITVSGQQWVFAIGANGAVWGESETGTAWNGWLPTNPGAVKQITALNDSLGNLNIFAIGMDNQVWYERSLGGGQWTGWALTQKGYAKAIAAPTTVVGGAPSQVFIIGADNQVWSETSNGAGWNGWTLTQRGAVKQISALMDSEGAVHVFAIGMDNQVWYENSLGNGAWSGWTLTQRGAVQQITTPTVVVSQGVLLVYAVGMDGQVWNETSANGFSGWSLTQRGAVKSITAQNTSTNTLVFAVGMDRQVYSETSGTPWTTWLLTSGGGVQ